LCSADAASLTFLRSSPATRSTSVHTRRTRRTTQRTLDRAPQQHSGAGGERNTIEAARQPREAEARGRAPGRAGSDDSLVVAGPGAAGGARRAGRPAGAARTADPGQSARLRHAFCAGRPGRQPGYRLWPPGPARRIVVAGRRYGCRRGGGGGTRSRCAAPAGGRGRREPAYSACGAAGRGNLGRSSSASARSSKAVRSRCRLGAVGSDLAVAAAQVLDEGMPGGEDPCGAVALQAAHRPEPGFQPAVIRLDRIIRVPLDDMQRRADQLAGDPRAALGQW